MTRGIRPQHHQRACHRRNHGGGVITEDGRLTAHDDVTNHGATRGRKHAHHDAGNEGQAVGNGLERACRRPQGRHHRITMRLHIIPGLALEVDKTRKERPGEGEVKVLRLAHRRYRATVNEHVTGHTSAEGGKHRDEEETHDVITALAGHRSANHAHEKDADNVGPVIQRLD